MLFNSPLFLFCFAPILFLTYFLSPRSIRNPILVLSSITFYAWGEPQFVGIVLLSTFLDWLIGNAIFRSRGEKAKIYLLCLGILGNVGILFYFKYAGFFVDGLNVALTSLYLNNIPAMTIALPIGISFIAFEKITYLVDIYKRMGKPAHSMISYFLYVLLFPKLLAGPIVKYHDIAGQLDARTLSAEDFVGGLKRFLIGLAKKVLIADTLQEVVDPIFKLSSGDLGFYNAWVGLICFTLQIYFDFSGYSDMAIGLARMMGFRLLENFNMPYISESFTEFWRRWHISLSTWIREYLYIPLGGNRVSSARMYTNLLLCFLLCGLWHGASWTFVIWGLYHGLFLIFDKVYWIDFQKSLPRFLNNLVTFFLVMIGWAIFRAESLPQASFYLSALFGLSPSGETFIYLNGNIKVSIFVGLAICFRSVIPGFEQALAIYNRAPWKQEYELTIALVLLLASIAKLAMTSFTPFLYFRF
jgi:alginate O-acetyltransferase complex protein AlgI